MNYAMKLILTIKNENSLDICLKQGRKTIDHDNLTINQNLDNMLIASIDRLLLRNRIDRLSLKDVRISGKIRPEAVSTMIIKAVGSAIGT